MCISKILPSAFPYLRMRAARELNLPGELLLRGEVFFISVSSIPAIVNRQLRQVIIQLGGKVETFFSNEITTILVEDSYIEDAKPHHPTISTFGGCGVSAVKTAYPYVNQTGLKKMPATTSRGYSLVSRVASISQKFPNDCPTLRLLDKARLWGIRVIGVKRFILWTEPKVSPIIRPTKRKQNLEIELIAKANEYFIKVEDLAQNFKPFYKVIPKDSKLLMHCLPVECVTNRRYLVDLGPWMVSEKANKAEKQLWKNNVICRKIENAPNRAQPAIDNLKLEKRNLKEKCEILINNQTKGKSKKNNYCECCRIHFSNLTQHVDGEIHQNFILDEKNYDCVAKLIDQLPTAQEFLKKYRPKDISHSNIKAYRPTSDVSFVEIPHLGVYGRGVNSPLNNYSVHIDHEISPIKTTDCLYLRNSNEPSIDFKIQELDPPVNMNDNYKGESLKKCYPEVFQYKTDISHVGDLGVNIFDNCWLDGFPDEDIHSLSGNNTCIENMCERNNIMANENPLSTFANCAIDNTQNTVTISKQFAIPKPTVSHGFEDKFNVHALKENVGDTKQNKVNTLGKADTIFMQSLAKFDIDTSDLQHLNLTFEESKLSDPRFGSTNMPSICHISDLGLEKVDTATADCSFFPMRTDRMFSSGNSDDRIAYEPMIHNAINIIDSSNILEKNEVCNLHTSKNNSPGNPKDSLVSLLSSSDDFPSDIPKPQSKSIWSVQQVTSDSLRLRFIRLPPTIVEAVEVTTDTCRSSEIICLDSS